MLGALNVAELALQNKGLLSASPSRVGDMENPTFFCFFVYAPPPSNTPSAVHGLSTSARSRQQQTYSSSNNSAHLSGVVFVASSPVMGGAYPKPSTFMTTTGSVYLGEVLVAGIGVLPTVATVVVQSHAFSSG